MDKDRQDQMGAQKFDSGKPDLSLVPLVAMEQMSLALMAGEGKYGRWNFCGGMEAGRLVGAALRHILKWYSQGIDYDQDCSERTGHQVSHLGCALANLAMLLEMQRLGTITDDRYQPPEAQVTPIIPRREVPNDQD